ncbi:MAG: membrane protein of unknown function [Promethearchaeota archaeon]|nr:MAG: membrane protein of unknown function [Candidatus Lokiarchaeota archaeon]
MKKSTHNEDKENLIEWLSIKTPKKYGYHLYFFSIIGIIFCMGIIGRYFYPVVRGFINDYTYEIPNILGVLIPLLGIGFFGYTILKLKPVLSKPLSDNEGVKTSWFGILIQHNNAPWLFIFALIALFSSLVVIIAQSPLMFNLSGASLQFSFIEFFYKLLYSMEAYIFVIFSLYSLKKARKFATKDSEKILWFGYELKKRAQLVVFILSIVGFFFQIYLIILSLPYLGDTIIYGITHRGIRSAYRIIYLFITLLVMSLALTGIFISFYSLFRIRKMSNESLN